MFGLDPLWSLGLAKKWCARSEWIHTTLFFAFVRDISSFLGKYYFFIFIISTVFISWKKENDVSDLAV